MSEENKEINKEHKKFWAREVSTMIGIISLVVFLIICVAGVGGYYYVAYQQDKKPEESSQNQPNKEEGENNQNNTTTVTSDFGTPTCPTTLTEAEITGDLSTWQKKENTTYNYTYYIPGDWNVFTPETSENVPEEVYYRDADFTTGFQNLEYLLDWKASAIYHAYIQQSSENIQVACNNATFKTAKVSDDTGLYLFEVNFTANSKKHQIFYFYKTLGSASLDSDFGEQFRLLLKTIEFE